MPKGIQLNSYVPKEDVRTLDAIAEAMAKGEIGIRPTRSQLVTKAIENFIQACQARDHLRQAIESVRKEFEREALTRNLGSKGGQRLKVVAPAS
ncbi:MAG: hypothetical protein WA517_08175 [Candidatus Acidiferrum sp.]